MCRLWRVCAGVFTPEKVEEPVAVSPANTAEAPAWPISDQAVPSLNKGMFSLIVSELLAFYDWLGGPPQTERERIEKKIAQTRHNRHTRQSGF